MLCDWCNRSNFQNLVSRLIWQCFEWDNAECNIAGFVSLISNIEHTLALNFVHVNRLRWPLTMFTFSSARDNHTFSATSYISTGFREMAGILLHPLVNWYSLYLSYTAPCEHVFPLLDSVCNSEDSDMIDPQILIGKATWISHGS